ncbi:MAG: hypothetical protein HWD92_05565 [Flavobacteriia bacterium]|nr:hypothetical protein [Flavobacteriia bacterium]
MHRLALSCFVIFGCNATYAQNADNSTDYPRNYDPTQLYSSVNVAAGLNRPDEKFILGSHPDGLWYKGELSWQFDLSGKVRLSEHFQVDFSLPGSNNEDRNALSVFDNASIDAKYLIHINSETYNSTLVHVGMTSPIVGDPLLGTASLVDAAPLSYELRAGYMGGIRLSSSISLYPSFELYQREVLQHKAVHFTDSSYLPPNEKQTGIRFGMLSSLQINPRLFVQVSLKGQCGNMSYSNGDFVQYFNSLNESSRSWSSGIKLAYFLTRNSQLFLSLNYEHQVLSSERHANDIERRISQLNVGYQYFVF